MLLAESWKVYFVWFAWTVRIKIGNLQQNRQMSDQSKKSANSGHIILSKEAIHLEPPGIGIKKRFQWIKRYVAPAQMSQKIEGKNGKRMKKETVLPTVPTSQFDEAIEAFGGFWVQLRGWFDCRLLVNATWNTLKFVEKQHPLNQNAAMCCLIEVGASQKHVKIEKTYVYIYLSMSIYSS